MVLCLGIEFILHFCVCIWASLEYFVRFVTLLENNLENSFHFPSSFRPNPKTGDAKHPGDSAALHAEKK